MLIKFKASVKGIKTKTLYRKDKPVHVDNTECMNPSEAAEVIKNRMGYGDAKVRSVGSTATGFSFDLDNDMRILCERY